MPSAYKMNWLELVYLFIRSPNYFRTVSMDVSFITFFACKHCNSLKHKNLICVHLIFGALRSILVRCKHYVSDARIAYLRIWLYVVCVVTKLGVKHALGTRLLQKCLRHSPPGVVCTQVWNLKELTEGHHKNAWSMWLNLTQRGKSYRVRTHWGLTGIITMRVFIYVSLYVKYASPFMIMW